MDHSTFTYLMAPEAGFLEFYASDVTPDDLADFRRMLRREAMSAPFDRPAAGIEPAPA